jgi:hypothetical protein
VVGNRIVLPMGLANNDPGNTIQLWVVVNGANTYQTISTP